jgi:hypothetical protein
MAIKKLKRYLILMKVGIVVLRANQIRFNWFECLRIGTKAMVLFRPKLLVLFLAKFMDLFLAISMVLFLAKSMVLFHFTVFLILLDLLPFIQYNT